MFEKIVPESVGGMTDIIEIIVSIWRYIQGFKPHIFNLCFIYWFCCLVN